MGNDWLPATITAVMLITGNVIMWSLTKRKRESDAAVGEAAALKSQGEYYQGVIDTLAKENGFLKKTIEELRLRVVELEKEVNTLKSIIRNGNHD